jgi:hypothetical protein
MKKTKNSGKTSMSEKYSFFFNITYICQTKTICVENRDSMRCVDVAVRGASIFDIFPFDIFIFRPNSGLPVLHITEERLLRKDGFSEMRPLLILRISQC